ncbi:MAG TPA: molecular chaperone DnaK [Bacillus bacterium]|nr:molecular chaperone DnaK [Bacillus sp. (in: firmicutes)]
MTDHYAKLKSELELMRLELEERLNRDSCYDREHIQSVAELFERDKNYILNQHIQAELYDVKRALLKMEFGLYGFCEETGERIPYEHLTIIPTVRTNAEAEAMTQFPYMRFSKSCGNLNDYATILQE